MNKDKRVLGINGLGRIGKLTLWHQAAAKHFDRIVVNLGRAAGRSVADIARYVGYDSTYGSLGRFFHGYRSGDVLTDPDESSGTLRIDGIPVTLLREHRNPAEIPWRDHGARLVVDTTGAFLDPTLPADLPGGSLRDHLTAGAEKVITSAPFKIRDPAAAVPDDSLTAIMGINEADYDPTRHRIVSAASCTTTCLAHMMKPIIEAVEAKRVLTASMATIHACTGTQEVLDRLPGPGAKDLRKNRSTFNNIILTSTGAAKALREVIPEMKGIGFMAESVRVPTTTGSLVILVVSLQEEGVNPSINRSVINGIYRDAAAREPRGYLVFTEEQNVSSDIIGFPHAGAIIEGHETHTRTAEVKIDMNRLAGCRPEVAATFPEGRLSIPMTQAVIYGWYDNEMGGYAHMLTEMTRYVAEQEA